jgi:peptidoglycan/LPS O-acetylase OafA/YrhL
LVESWGNRLFKLVDKFSLLKPTPSVKKAGYRSDIDGLRALAVIGVLLYHLGFDWIPGGFVGVDVFFVISGYVIFSSVHPLVSEGRFRASTFFIKRFYRLYPALFVVVSTSILYGYFVLSPKEYVFLAQSASYAAIGFSNIFFQDNAGNYFSNAAESNPLLHTWSLGIEEQFYLIAVLVFIYFSRNYNSEKFKRFLIIGILFSFLLNLMDVYLFSRPHNAFYLPTHRVWELALGGLLALNRDDLSKSYPNAAWVSNLGFLMVLSSFLYVETSALFPGYVVILPVLGAILLISFPAHNSASHRLLNSSMFRGVGRISYSIYLVHWPLIVYFKLQTGVEKLHFTIQVLIFFITILLGFILYVLVESNFRYAWKYRGLYVRTGLSVSLLFVCFTSFFIAENKGFPKRVNSDDILVEKLIKLCPAIEVDNLPKVNFCGKQNAEGSYDFVFWGDSHADALKPGIIPILEENKHSYAFVTMLNCPPLIGVDSSKKKNKDECDRLGRKLEKMSSNGQIRNLVLASRWASYDSPVISSTYDDFAKHLISETTGLYIGLRESLENTVLKFEGLGSQVVIVGPVPEYSFNVPQVYLRSKLNDFEVSELDLQTFKSRQENVLPAINHAESTGATVFYPHLVLCDEEVCKYKIAEHVIYADDHHLNAAGADAIASALFTILAR